MVKQWLQDIDFLLMTILKVIQKYLQIDRNTGMFEGQSFKLKNDSLFMKIIISQIIAF